MICIPGCRRIWGHCNASLALLGMVRELRNRATGHALIQGSAHCLQPHQYCSSTPYAQVLQWTWP
jgi:hypothetical protein